MNTVPVLTLAGLAAMASVSTAQQGPERATAPRVSPAFVANHGQWPAHERFRTRSGRMQIALSSRGWRCLVPGDGGPRCVELRFSGTGSDARLRPEARAAGVHHYLIGADPGAWRQNVPLYESVLYEGLYAGIDVRARHAEKEFEYDLLLAPGADLDVVQVQVSGGGQLSLDAEGHLCIGAGDGELRQSPPVAWEVLEGGKRRPVTCRFRILGRDRFGFVAPDRVPGRRLVVDPRLIYSSFLGGGADDEAWVVRHSAGAFVIAGGTDSSNFPVSPNAYDPSFNLSRDAFVTVLDPNAANQLVSSTFIGGKDFEEIRGMEIDSSGVLHLVGITRSSDFPFTANAWKKTHSGLDDIVYLQLDPKSNAPLVYSTSIGTGGVDLSRVGSFAIDNSGVVWIVGSTDSSLFPTTPNAYNGTHKGGRDGVLLALDTRMGPAQQLRYATFFGGIGDDEINCVHVLPAGRLAIAGFTDSFDLPTTPGCYDSSYNGVRDGFVGVFDPGAPAGKHLVWSTFLGGSDLEVVRCLDIDRQGDVHVAGMTFSRDFPTTKGAYQSGTGGTWMGFVTQLKADGSGLITSTMFGSTVQNTATDLFGMKVDAQDRIVICGSAGGASAPPTTPDALKRQNFGIDAYVAMFDPTASRLLHSTLIGDMQGETFRSVDLVGGEAVLAGFTTAPQFPTTAGAFDRSHNGMRDVIAVRYALDVPRATRYGDPTKDCRGRQSSIHATDSPAPGKVFELSASQGIPNRNTYLLVSLARSNVRLPYFDIVAHVDLTAPGLIIPRGADGLGEVKHVFTIPANTSGTVYAQFVWDNGASCPQAPFSATDGMNITW